MALIKEYTGNVPPTFYSGYFPLNSGTYYIVHYFNPVGTWRIEDTYGGVKLSGAGFSSGLLTISGTEWVQLIVDTTDEWSTFYVTIDDDASPPTPPGGSSDDFQGFLVYELDKGWSFDGMYIPHYLEMNWYFGEDPFTDKTISKVRIHGLAKGRTKLSLAVAGMQTEYDGDYTEPQHIDLPRNSEHISTEYVPTTNYVDSSNWGVSLQMKFEGRNIDLSQPEPAHVLQVLALQSSPQGNGKRIN